MNWRKPQEVQRFLDMTNQSRCKVAAYRSRKELAQADHFIWMQHSYNDLRESEGWDTLSHDRRVTALKKKIDRTDPGQNDAQFALMDRQEQWPHALAVLEGSWRTFRRDFHDEEPPEAER